ncbi:hypothetical protein BKA64DRAFT_136381 [Cadophora sp. MPI-SDFR-AT-0126]|nr:hypothetical protein BKA64DRAFT_136381 [Leotiomycetes sp. MPI-SDFR-AT-0126]
MQSRPSNWQAPGSIPQQSMHRRQPQFDNWQAPDNIPQETAYGQPPPHCGFYPPTTQYLQGNNVYAPQQQNVPMHPIPTSFLPALAQNMTPYGYGTPAQQSFQGYNGAYNQLGFNMTYLQTQPHHGPYQPNGSYASSAQVQPALRSQPIQQLTSAINNSPDIASKAGCFEYLKGLTHVVGTQGRRQRLRTSEGFSEPPETVKSFRPHLGPDGGFCCPSCPKTYARVKHVKRHFLQHTGSRPFVCQFCGTDFERSDTWKRHYKRCAGRRGVAVEPGDHLLPSVNQEHINQEHINQEQSGSSNPMLPTGS